MTPTQRRREILRVLRASLRGHRADVIGLVVWSAIQSAPAILSGLLIARAIDQGFLAGDTATGLAWLGLFGVSVVAGAIATRHTFLRLAAIIEPFRDELVTRTVRAALRRATTPGASAETAGIARLTHQVEIAREAYASALLVVQAFLVSMVGAVIGLTALAPVFLVFVLPPVAVALALFFTALPGMAKRQRRSIMADEQIAETAGTVTGGLRDIVACGAEERVAWAVGEHIDGQARATKELARFTAIRTLSVALGGWLPTLLILGFGSWLLDQGLTIGAILGALTYTSQGVHGALRTLVQGIGNTGLWLFVSMARIVEATHEPEQATTTPEQAPASSPIGHDVHLRGVTFGYGRSPEPVIRDFDLAVPEDDHLAIVGPSGVGKSTLAGLISGLLVPQSGELRLGGAAMRGIDPRIAAQMRVLIPQEAYVFAGTLRENLAYLRPDATPAELDGAVDMLGMRSLADRLGGYDAEIKGSMLSAGEAQLITLVRAYLSPAPLVILDEAACHLDAVAEARV
ncbi:MAG: ATP-binding cassette, subfamily bacterial RamB/AmfA, partial [Solirubrobacteraceae bacterium]|nr:ATP-binding cassette, subfamily bacterial RamB/AmfA [Solirubrobacteraceae bacterium]